MLMTFLLSSAEKFLESVEVNQNYPLLLLHLVDKEDVHQTIRVAGAVAFKNYVKRNWKVVSSVFLLLLFSIFFRLNKILAQLFLILIISCLSSSVFIKFT